LTDLVGSFDPFAFFKPLTPASFLAKHVAKRVRDTIMIKSQKLQKEREDLDRSLQRVQRVNLVNLRKARRIPKSRGIIRILI